MTQKRELKKLDDILPVVEQMAREAMEHRKRIERLARNEPDWIRCETHVKERRLLNIQESSRQSRELAKTTWVYDDCPKCAEMMKLRLQSVWLANAGVPANLVHCSFDNFRVESAEDRLALTETTRLVKDRVGMVILLGDVGRGKSHLGVSALRSIGQGRFTTHSDLVLGLRKTYRDSHAPDVIERAKRSELLVLDEYDPRIEASDEHLMIQSIFYDRYGNHKPFIITGNFARNQIPQIMGERFADRIMECAAVIELRGKSRRQRQSYGRAKV